MKRRIERKSYKSAACELCGDTNFNLIEDLSNIGIWGIINV
jgi:hypothetical protein